MMAGSLLANPAFETDTIQTSEGSLVITFIGHASLMMEFDGTIIHIDPVSQYADYSKLPKADLILITHHHSDHFDLQAVDSLKKGGTVVILTKKCSEQLSSGKVLSNGYKTTALGFEIEAVPAYNTEHMRSPGNPYHPKGEGNGYLIRFGDKTVYVAGDTENIPEMKNLKDVDIVFLPMNLPYTMSPDMVAGAAKVLKPKILYPYHYGNTDTGKLARLMKGEKEIEVRIRNLR